MRTLLNVATGQDVASRFKRTRSEFIEEVSGEHFDVNSLPSVIATKQHLLRYCGQKNNAGDDLYQGICIAGHGNPGIVYDKNGNGLFSNNYEQQELVTVVSQRAIYLFACQTAEDEFVSRIMNSGCTLFIGFTQSPRWVTTDGARLWSELDISIIRSIGFDLGKAGIESVVQEFLQRTSNQVGRYSDAFDLDLTSIQQALHSLVVLSN